MATPHSSIELTGRGKTLLWLAGISAGIAWISGDHNARIAAAILAAPILVDFVARQRRLHLTRIHIAPRRTVAGAFYIESVQVEHRGNRPLRGCYFYEPLLMRNEPAALLPTLQPLETHRTEIQERSLIRSHIIQRVIVLESRWPLGMFLSRSVVTADCDLVTEPRRVELSLNLLESSTNTQSASIRRKQEIEPDFYELRKYVYGEDARGVHALRSAALGSLVRQVHRELSSQTVGVILDLRQQPGDLKHQGDRQFEWSLGACAWLAEKIHQSGSMQRILVIDTQPELLEIRNSIEMMGLMTLLSEASLSTHHSIEPSLLIEINALSQCYWIAAGGYTRAPELLNIAKEVTVIKELGDS